jgi:NodT family efflux transporter outer membrane factor (OMF) lipoprotein
MAALMLFALGWQGCATSLREWARNGFKVGPNYAPPPAPVAPAWIDSDSPVLQGEPIDECQWWTIFDDTTLNGLIEMARGQNLDLRVAGTRILEARAQRNIAVGNLFPQSQSAIATYVHGELSENLALSAALGGPLNIWATGFNPSWELDFWGRYRRSVEAANADFGASVEEYGDALVMLYSEVATAYVQLRTFEERLRFARQNIEIQEGTLSLAEHRYREGVATELDVRQARTSLAQTQSALHPLETGRRRASNQLCILLGMPVVDLAAEFEQAPIPTAPPRLAVGIPADLLRRRPDVRRAERQVAAQSARIGVAEADLYPRLSLNGFLGYAADDLDRLFQAKSFTAFIIPTLQWNILNYGRIANNITVQDVRLEAAALRYQQAVIAGGRDVEDALVGFLQAQQQARRLEGGVRDAERSVELVLIQFKNGVTDFNRVFNTQVALVTQQDQLAVARGDVALNLIQVYKALGGGWKQASGGSRMPPVDGIERLPPAPQTDENLPRPSRKALRPATLPEQP